MVPCDNKSMLQHVVFVLHGHVTMSCVVTRRNKTLFLESTLFKNFVDFI